MGGGVSIKKYLYGIYFLLHVGVIKSWFLLNLSCIDSSCHLINIWRTLPYKMMVRNACNGATDCHFIRNYKV